MTSGLSRQCHLSLQPLKGTETRMGRVPCRNTLFKDPRLERSGARSFHVPVGLGLPDITLGMQVRLG